jgi:hypothetical protein
MSILKKMELNKAFVDVKEKIREERKKLLLRETSHKLKKL